MLEPHTLYAKTEAGREAMAARNRGLTPRERQVLILLNGKRHVHEVTAMLPAIDCAATAQRLLELGLIAPATANPTPPAAGAALSASGLAAASETTLASRIQNSRGLIGI